MSTDYETATSHDARNGNRSATADPRSIADLIRELRDESTSLLREEIALAKTEMAEKANRLTRNVVLLIVGGAVAHLGLIFLLLAGSAGLERFYDSIGLWFHGDWIAPLVVGLIVGLIGAVMILKAKKTLQNGSPVPQRTLDSLKEDQQWLRNKTH